MDSKRSFKTVSYKNLLATNKNGSVFFGSKMGQTKHKPLRTRDFLRFAERNCGLHMKHFFFFFENKYNEQNITLQIK